MRPRLLDLFCGEGGSAQGYINAGFDVTGVDNQPRFNKRYPGTFVCGDAVDWAWEEGPEYDAIHASPPCQHASAGTRAIRARSGERYPALIEATRIALEASGLPYIIENVKGAALVNPVTLCGTMFGLRATDDDGTLLHLQRHRLFESNIPLLVPQCQHQQGVQWAGSYGGARRDKADARNVRHGGYVPSISVQQLLLGIDWMTEAGMHQAIPPAYTEHIGWQLLAALEVAA